MRKIHQSQEDEGENPLEYLRDMANHTSWEGFAGEISAKSGEPLASTTLWRAATRGTKGLKFLRLTVGQFHALSEITGLSFEELFALSREPVETTRLHQSGESELN